MLQALDKLYETLKPLGQSNDLNEKLAEYAFFPLSTCFNETKRLSSRCLEVSIRCLQILVVFGWKRKLPGATGKQLLILLTWIAGGGPGQEQRSTPSEELVIAALECMNDIFVQLGKTEHADEVLNEVGAGTVVDQVSYLLLEAIEGSSPEALQIAALGCLRQLWSLVSSRPLLASILPRTVSALTKASRSTTKSRRTVKTLVAILETLTEVIKKLLNDQSVTGDTEPQLAHEALSADEVILDKAWLDATTAQMKLALAQIVQLRSHGRREIQEALGNLCVMVIEECNSTLADSINLMTDTLVVICSNSDDETNPLLPVFNHIMTSYPAISEYLKSSLYSWTTSLPRIMQGNDDAPKQKLLRQISFTFGFLSKFDDTSELLDDTMVNTLVESVTAALHAAKPQVTQKVSESVETSLQPLSLEPSFETSSFQPVIMDHHTQRGSLKELQALVARLQSSNVAQRLTTSLVQTTSSSQGDSLVSSVWLSLLFLKNNSPAELSIEEFLDIPDSSPSTSRPYLIEELYSNTIQYLEYDSIDNSSSDWRLTALALEVLTLQSSQLGPSFRTELIDTLYPVLSLLGANNPRLREHAMTALNQLAQHLEYSSVSNMLIENVDYLINSAALKLNTFDVSPQGPLVILMMLRLCGSQIIPFLDDLIISIFAALDTFHGYPRLVEILFQVLDAVVDESSKTSENTIALIEGPTPQHKKQPLRPPTVDDILSDLHARKKRKIRPDSETDPLGRSHPERPWTSAVDGTDPSTADPQDPEVNLEENEDDTAPLPKDNDADKTPTLSKPHSLLLSIARSTTPHLSSPSPAVRLTCLTLLNRLIPLLGRDETSFLPVVNDIWPAVISRLFTSTTTISTSDDDTDETVYIRTAAARVIETICINAGDFMSGRIEEIFPHLQKLYLRIWSTVEDQRRRSTKRPIRSNQFTNWQSGSKLSGEDGSSKPIEIRTRETSSLSQDLKTLTTSNIPTTTTTGIIKSSSPLTATATTTTTETLTPISTRQLTSTSIPSNQPISSSSSQTSLLHTSLLSLLSKILQYVRIPDEMGLKILDMVSPAIFGRYGILKDGDGDGRSPMTTREKDASDVGWGLVEALEVWNLDAVWLERQRQRVA